MEDQYEPIDLARLLSFAPKGLRERLGRVCARAYAEGYSAGWAEALSAASQRALVAGELDVTRAHATPPTDLEQLVARLADPIRVDVLFLLASTIWKAVEMAVVEVAPPALREEGRLAGRTDLLLELLTQQLGPASAHHRALALGASDEQRDTLLAIALADRTTLPLYHCPTD